MDKFLKRPPPASETAETPKAQKLAPLFAAPASSQAASSDVPKLSVSTLVSWNANSLSNRLTSAQDRAALEAFMRAHQPDVLHISEVRMPAQAPPGAKKNDGKPRVRGSFSKADKKLQAEVDAILSWVSQMGYRAYWSLSDWKYAGSALLVRRSCAQPRALRYSLDLDAPPSAHEAEGRVIFASFEDFDLLGMYVPNNGSKLEAFARRRQWDADVAKFLAGRPGGRPVVVLGDLNVAAGWEDVGPSPEWFRDSNGLDPNGEGWEAGDKGQPGFTQNEQRRFAALLAEAGLFDAYRHLHPTPDWRRDVTWRGAPAVSGPPEAGRYYDKGMRIDYVLLSSSLLPRAARAEVLGRGKERSGFLGSDHCPLLVELAPSGAASSPADLAALAAAPTRTASA